MTGIGSNYAAARCVLYPVDAIEMKISLVQYLGSSQTLREVGDWPSRGLFTTVRTGAKNRQAVVRAPGSGWVSRRRGC